MSALWGISLSSPREPFEEAVEDMPPWRTRLKTGRIGHLHAARRERDQVVLAAAQPCPLTVVSMFQLGGEEDGVWANPVLEPHHTHHTVGEAHQVSTLGSPSETHTRAWQNKNSPVEDLPSDLGAL